LTVARVVAYSLQINHKIGLIALKDKHCCYPFLGSHKKNEKIQKISKKYSKEIQKIIGARKGCWNAKKKPKLVEEVQKCKRLKFDNIFFDRWVPCWQRKFKLRKKSLKSDVYGLN